MVPEYDGMHSGYVPCGVTAHGSPGGPLQFDRLEAAFAAKGLIEIPYQDLPSGHLVCGSIQRTNCVCIES
jgi:hypothetical protein